MKSSQDYEDLDDVSGELRIQYHGGIIYVVGKGNLIPVRDREEAVVVLAELESFEATIH